MATSKRITVDINVEVRAAAKSLEPAVKRLVKALRTLDPKTMPVGALADLLYDLRQIKALPASLSNPFNDVLEPTIKAVEEHFVQVLKVGESSGVQGSYSRVQVNDSIIPVVQPDGWPKLYAYIKKNNAFDLLGRSLKKDAVEERWKNKKQVPGVGKFHAKKVSCTKLASAKAVK